MSLDDRKKRILKAIVDDYINTAEPVGSRTVAKRHDLGLSSATIRNEMSDLEDLGYLAQPHTSAGRIPSDKGYRYYVDQLIDISSLSNDEMTSIKKAMEGKIDELSQLIRLASTVISKVTNYISMATTPELTNNIVKALQVVPIESQRALVIVVLNGDLVRNTVIRMPAAVRPDLLIMISNLLNETLAGQSVAAVKINLKDFKLKEEIMNIPGQVMAPVYDGILACIDKYEKSEVFLGGTKNIFNYPEFKDVDRARDFLTMLEEKDVVFELLSSKGNIEVNIQIGEENVDNKISDCTLITTDYSIGKQKIGNIGIIGPTRMDYAKAISTMYFVRRKINEEIIKLLGDDEL